MTKAAIDPSLAQARREISIVERFLKQGFAPATVPGNRTTISATAIAADTMDCDRHSLRSRVGTPDRPGLWQRQFKLSPDWSLYRAPKPKDEIAQHREKQNQRDVLEENRRLRDALVEMQDIRAGVLKLTSEPLRPRYDAPKASSKAGARTVIIHLSDWHCGETVALDQMEGLNSFNLDIFRKRVSRLTFKARELLTTHWKGSAPEKIILIFGGDMITGEIHEELAKTNDALSAPAVRECAERLAGLVMELRKIAPLEVYSVPGNHGRLTRKPESKGMVVNSFDTLITSIVEMVVKLNGGKGVQFFYPQSGDAVFSVYHLNFVALHGDRMGSKGGQGFMGPIATILRGIAKTRAYYAAQGKIIHYVLSGHLHTTSELPRGFSNGSLIGASEYSRDLKADPEQSSQNMIVIHSEQGVIDFQRLKPGEPSEGSIYRAAA
jgi:predicted MPP superfamily phosphohydrolase